MSEKSAWEILAGKMSLLVLCGIMIIVRLGGIMDAGQIDIADECGIMMI